jgi:hypothetical protein
VFIPVIVPGLCPAHSPAGCRPHGRLGRDAGHWPLPSTIWPCIFIS